MRTLVYCEDGAHCKRLKHLQRCEQIALVVFPYEVRSGKVRRATPSKQTADSSNVLASDTFLVSEVESEMYPHIKRIVGGEFDCRHIDSAFKSGCKWFFTRDKATILIHRDKLEKLLDMRFLHSDDVAVLEEWLQNQNTRPSASGN